MGSGTVGDGGVSVERVGSPARAPLPPATSVGGRPATCSPETSGWTGTGVLPHATKITATTAPAKARACFISSLRPALTHDPLQGSLENGGPELLKLDHCVLPQRKALM